MDTVKSMTPLSLDEGAHLPVINLEPAPKPTPARMRLWHLEWKEGADPPVWDANHGFIVAAQSDRAARRMVNDLSGDEHRAYRNPWLDINLTSCNLIGFALDGAPSQIILRDFHSG